MEAALVARGAPFWRQAAGEPVGPKPWVVCIRGPEAGGFCQIKWLCARGFRRKNEILRRRKMAALGSSTGWRPLVGTVRAASGKGLVERGREVNISRSAPVAGSKGNDQCG